MSGKLFSFSFFVTQSEHVRLYGASVLCYFIVVYRSRRLDCVHVSVHVIQRFFVFLT
jgi:hypothetical protein